MSCTFYLPQLVNLYTLYAMNMCTYVCVWQRFYKDIEKEELYVKYIYKLVQLHEADHNFTEAGFTFLLHARGLEWNSDEKVAAVDKYPAQMAQEEQL